MEDALIFVFRALIELYIITFVLRLILQWIRADTRNPLVQFILRVTNPLVVPLRRYVPTAWGFDTATFIVLFVIQALATTALLNVACTVTPHIGQIISLSLLRLVHLALNVYLFLILAYVILSWIGPGGYNPAVSLLGNIVQPALRPLRRWIPPGPIQLNRYRNLARRRKPDRRCNCSFWQRPSIFLSADGIDRKLGTRVRVQQGRSQ